MREWTAKSHLEEAFRKELLRLIDEYLSFPDDATLGKIVCTLVTLEQARAALEDCPGTLVMRISNAEGAAIPRGRGTKPRHAAKTNLRLAPR